MKHVPTGIIFILDLGDASRAEFYVNRPTVKNVSTVFEKEIEFAVCSCSITTRAELSTIISKTLQYPFPKSCHYVGFFFIGTGMVDPNSQPFFRMYKDAAISVQKDILNPFQNAKELFPDQKLMFFFDCCFCCDEHSTTEKPFAFDFPPNSIVAFATSPGKRSFRGKTACITRWSKELCDQLEKVQKGHTLAEVLEVTTAIVMKDPDFKQHAPQFYSCTGPIVLKGTMIKTNLR